MSNKFIRHKTGKDSAPSQPAQEQRQNGEVLSTRTHEFPQERGVQQSARHHVAAQPVQINPVVPPAAPTALPVTQSPPSQSTKTHAETDPEFMSVDLPSAFQFYPFKTLSARNFKGAHLAKFSRANKEGKLRYSVEGLSASLEPGVSGFDLTPGDFYFLMYWQRVNSFSRNPMVITAYCDNEDHNHSVYIGDEVPDEANPGETKVVKKEEETLKTETILQHTTLETKYAEPVDLTPFAALTAKYNLGVETMRDVVELTELLQDLEGEPNEEQLFLAKYAPFLKTCPEHDTFPKKLLKVGEMDGDELHLMDQYIEAVTAYGVSEHAMIKCKECSAKMSVKIAIDALTFLPGSR